MAIGVQTRSTLTTICDAIRTHHRLIFDYEGLPRIVEPYCHGWSSRGAAVLRAIQVRGSSSSGGFGFRKLWTVSKMERVLSHLNVQRRQHATQRGASPGDEAAAEHARAVVHDRSLA